MQKYDLEPWQVQVEVQMVLNDTTAKQVKRASENELLAADTTILPTTLNSSETEAVVQVSAPQAVVQVSAPQEVVQVSAPQEVVQVSAPQEVVQVSAPQAVVQVSAPQEVVRLVHCSSIYIIVIAMVSCCIGS